MSKEKIVEKLRGLGVVPEAKDKEESKGNGDTTTDKSSVQYGRIQSLLKNNIWNHAGIMDILWKESGGSNASNRSKFRKKLEQEKSDDGSTYSFTEEEISDIMGILSNAASSVTQKKRKE